MMVLVAAAGAIAPEENGQLAGSVVPTLPSLPTVLPSASPSATSAPPVVIVEPSTQGAAPPAPTSLPTPTAGPFDAALDVPADRPPLIFPAATAGVPAPLPTPAYGLTATVNVPILMYHYISEPPADADEYREDLSVSPQAFREQLQYLADNGYTPIDLYDLILAVTRQAALPPKPVILTFDDGYLDHYTNAFPLLREYGFKATFFIITGWVDNGSAAHMNWAMIEEMAAAGMRMESHSKSHPDLTEAEDEEELIWQILGSQETLAAHIGYTPRFFCYPGGRYNDEIIAVLQKLDFWGAVNTASGKLHGHGDRYEWTRLRMRYTTTLPVFADFVDASGS
jgi:peptidoglycan/xylan/chitin deacetylase (PgdA/CDA1 family)